MKASLQIIVLSVAGAVLYGICQDQITARVCLEYFTLGHPKVIESTSPTALAFTWGVIATWWVGLPLGMVLAVAARAGSRPQVAWRQLLRPLAVTLVLVGVLALAAGLVTWLWTRGDPATRVSPDIASFIPAAKQVAFQADAATHLMAYAAGFLGGLGLCLRTWVHRGSRAPSRAANPTPVFPA